jgi:PhnB protein
MKTLNLPAGHRTVVPYFLVPDADAFIQFLKTAFHARDKEMHHDEDGDVRHAELTIGDAPLDAGPKHGKVESAGIHELPLRGRHG